MDPTSTVHTVRPSQFLNEAESTAASITSSVTTFSGTQVASVTELLETFSDDLEAYIIQNGADRTTSWPFSKENRALIGEVSEFMKSHTAECEGISLVSMWQYFIAWSIVQRAARNTLWTFPRETDTPRRWRLEEAAYYSKFSVGVYGKSLVNMLMNSQYLDLFRAISPRAILSTYAGILPDDVVYMKTDSQPFHPAYAICIDRAQKSIVLTIRGTLSLTDCMTDLKAEYMPYDFKDALTQEVRTRGSVHEGIFKGALNVYEATKPVLLEVIAGLQEDYSLIIAGHSLGAGTSALLGLIWMSDPDLAMRGFRVYCYGPPCVVSPELQPYLKANTMSVSLGTDFITRACFGSFKDLVKVLLFFKEREQHLGQLTASQIMKGSYGSEPIEESKLAAVYLQAKREFDSPKHYPPGVIYQIYNRERNTDHQLLPHSSKQFVGEFADPSFFSEIVFSRTILTDHMPDMYEQAVNAVLYA
jgi:hypothetical protein